MAAQMSPHIQVQVFKKLPESASKSLVKMSHSVIFAMERHLHP
jgi:hypothetical protein